jgi:hypothetical protein
LNAAFDREAILNLISGAVERHKISLPLRGLTRDEALLAFRQLRDIDAIGLISSGEFSLRHEYTLKPKSATYIEQSLIGNSASNYFHERPRSRCAGLHFPSFESIWATDAGCKRMLRALWSLKVDRVNSTTLRGVHALRNYQASQFRPSAAKAIYDYFRAERVLDFSMGWGDRLAGFCASQAAREYVGCDPNRALHKNYRAQVRAYGSDKRITTIPTPAEDCTFKPNHFDLCFTSPPYFRNERYSHDIGQSWKRYPQFEVWLEKFLFAALRKAYRALKPNGFLIINVSDVWISDRVAKICDPMNEFLASLGMSYCDCWGLRISIRPGGTPKPNYAPRCEPIWIWRKGSRVSVSGLNHPYAPSLRDW